MITVKDLINLTISQFKSFKEAMAYCEYLLNEHPKAGYIYKAKELMFIVKIF